MDELLILGRTGGTHVGASLHRAAGPGAAFLDTEQAFEGPRLVRAALWRLGRRPPRLQAFNRLVLEAAERRRATTVLCAGNVPLTATTLQALRRRGVRTLLFTTDDPFSPLHRARWSMRALPHYRTVFTPRRRTLGDFQVAGVRDVRYLPFGYDPRWCVGNALTEEERAGLGCDVLGVGGADADRAALLRPLIASGLDVGLYGGYWSRWRWARPAYRGIASPEDARKATLAARVVVCLVRRANRDEHTMRTYEAAATGGCLLVEDTPDHRALFGGEEACVSYFRNGHDLLAQARRLCGLPEEERQRRREQVRALLRGGRHTYADRLASILSDAQGGTGGAADSVPVQRPSLVGSDA